MALDPGRRVADSDSDWGREFSGCECMSREPLNLELELLIGKGVDDI